MRTSAAFAAVVLLVVVLPARAQPAQPQPAQPQPAPPQMFKCVDERGVTTYSDKPRPGCKGSEVDIRPQAPLSGKLEQGGADAARQEVEFKIRQMEREQAEFQQNAQRRQQCASIRKDLSRLSQPGRIVESQSENGERVYLDDKVREERLASLRERLRACP